MKTRPLYLEDSYLQSMDAIILEVQPEGNNRWKIVLDTTVFYPMGGGQPTDQGVLAGVGWTGKVYQVLTKDGEIWHFVESEQRPTDGLTVHGQIDWKRRYQNMRVHSAGHVVDFAMYLLGYSPMNLKPMKGDHGKKSYIVYSGILGIDIVLELEAKSNELVMKKMKFVTSIVPLPELEKEAIYLQPGLPTNKPLRRLTLVGVGAVADGGTQVKNTSELGKIFISGVQEENGNTIVTYRIA